MLSRNDLVHFKIGGEKVWMGSVQMDVYAVLRKLPLKLKKKYESYWLSLIPSTLAHISMISQKGENSSKANKMWHVSFWCLCE